MRSVTGVESQLRVELVPQAPRLGGETDQRLCAVRRVEEASEKPKKPRKARTSPGEEAAEGAAAHWEHHDEQWQEFEILCHKKQRGAAKDCIASQLEREFQQHA